MSLFGIMRVKNMGAKHATAMLLISTNVVIVVTLAPNNPPTTGEAVATGAKIHIIIPCASDSLMGRSTRYMATPTRI